MRTRHIVLLILFVFTISGCPFANGPTPDDQAKEQVKLPNIDVAKELPVFITEKSEVEIADSYNDIDPAFVVGTLIDIDAKLPYGFNSFLKEGEKIEYIAKSDKVFDFWTERKLSTTANWLNFVSMHLNDQVKARVSVVKVGRVNVLMDAINMTKVKEFSSKLSPEKRKKFGVVTGYADFLVTASLFKDMGVGGSASGYGAKIEGKWYSKFGNEIAYHRLIATWTPLMFLIEEAAPKLGQPNSKTPLSVFTDRAIKRGALSVRKLDAPLVINK